MKKVYKSTLVVLASLFLLGSCTPQANNKAGTTKSPIEYVNPYMGNISHLLVPTYPTVHLPNSMMRVYPERADFTGDRLGGLPLIVTSHRGSSAFNLSPYQGDESGLQPVIPLSYDQEKLTPYRYQVYLDEQNIDVDFAPSRQSAVYSLTFENEAPSYLVFNTRRGEIEVNGNAVSGFQYIEGNTKVYLYAEIDKTPEKVGTLTDGAVKTDVLKKEGENAAVVMAFPSNVSKVGVRYGVSFIDVEQAKKNLQREIAAYDVDVVAKAGQNAWNQAVVPKMTRLSFILHCIVALSVRFVSAKMAVITVLMMEKCMKMADVLFM